MCLCMFVCMCVDDTSAIGRGAMYDERMDRIVLYTLIDGQQLTNYYS